MAEGLSGLKTAWTRLIPALLALIWAGMADSASVAIVLSEDAASYQGAAASLRAALGQGGAPVSFESHSLSGRKPDFSRIPPDIIVAVGARAAREMLALNTTAPVLAMLIQHQTYEMLVGQAGRRQFSAIFLDQPLSRQMALIRLSLPGRGRVGAVLGPESRGDLKALQAAAKAAQLELTAETVSAAAEVLPALRRVLADSDILLALPDPLVFDKGTIQSLLLTSYRYQDPVVAFSRAYVSAGALAAVYTTPEQAGRQAGEYLLRVLATKPWLLPPPEYPKYFSIAVNYQVARSLGVRVSDEGILYQRLMSQNAE